MGKRTGLQKIMVLVATAALAAASLAGCGSPAEPGLPEVKWTQISEGQYRKIAGGDGADLILESVPQEIDHEVILEQLVDPNVEPDLAAVEAVKNDPNATLPDNYLPDGRVLVENWIELERQIVEVLSEKKTAILRDGQLMDDFQETTVWVATTGPGAEIRESLELKKYVDGEKEYLFTADGMKLQKGPGKHQWICGTDQNIWLVDLESNTARGLIPETYKGMTYEEICNLHSKQTGWDYVYWSGNPDVNPSGSKVVYTSDKEELSNWNEAVFMIHLDGDVPTHTLHASSADYNYSCLGWINDEEFLCRKTVDGGSEMEIVLLDIHGVERPVKLEVDYPYFIEIRGETIVYKENTSRNVYVAKYRGEGMFEMIVYIPVEEGDIIHRSGDGGLNPSGNKFAFLYRPEMNSRARYFQVFDLEEQKMIAELAVPEGARDPAGIHEIWWINDDELLVTVRMGLDTDEAVRSTWIYNVNGN